MMRRSTRSTTSCEVESEVYPVRKFWRELDRVSVAVTELTQRSREQQEALRAIIEQRLDSMRADNTEKLENIRQTVDEKLQSTLNERLGASFQVVSDWLEKVHRSMGEMQTSPTEWAISSGCSRM